MRDLDTYMNHTLPEGLRQYWIAALKPVEELITVLIQTSLYLLHYRLLHVMC